MPTNVVPIWVGEGDLVLTEVESGLVVEFEIEELENTYEPHLVVLPATELLAWTGYQLDGGPEDFDAEGDGNDIRTFWTGTGPVDGVPSVPRLIDVEITTDSAETIMGPWVMVDITTDIEPDDDVYLEAEVVGDDGSIYTVLADDETIRLADTDCQHSVDGMAYMDSFSVRLRANSYTGQAGDWSESQSVTIPWHDRYLPLDEGCGCSSLGGGGACALRGVWMVLLGLIASLRRSPGNRNTER